MVRCNWFFNKCKGSVTYPFTYALCFNDVSYSLPRPACQSWFLIKSIFWECQKQDTMKRLVSKSILILTCLKVLLAWCSLLPHVKRSLGSNSSALSQSYLASLIDRKNATPIWKLLVWKKKMVLVNDVLKISIVDVNLTKK